MADHSNFDRAWRKSKEDEMARSLQEAYDSWGDDANDVQRWFHVAQPIKTMMPNTGDEEHNMFRSHIDPIHLLNDDGEYIGADEAMKVYEEEQRNLGRKRKNPKDPKHSRIFIPNPKSKDIGDFHIDEKESEKWQEKLAGETMTAFDRAWGMVKG